VKRAPRLPRRRAVAVRARSEGGDRRAARARAVYGARAGGRLRPLPRCRPPWATERAFPPPSRQDPILLDGGRALVSERAGAELAPRATRGTEEALQFAVACEAARDRLVVSYARRATGESRPRLPSVFFREIASQLVGERVSAEQAPLLSRPDVQRIPGDAIGAPIPGGRYATDPQVVSAAAAGAISESERDRTYLQASVTQPWAVATFERAAPAFARALAASRGRWSGSYSEWDGALGERALAAIASLVPAGRTFSSTALENYCKCPQQFLMGDVLRVRGVEEPERRCGSTRSGAAACFTGSSSASTPNRTGVARRRSRRTRPSACERSPVRSATRRRAAARPGIRRCGAADRLEVIDDCLQWLEVERADPVIRQLPLGACEARFGRRHPGEEIGELSRDEPISIGLDGRELLLSGRIGRINWDQARTRFRVIDYKTARGRPARGRGCVRVPDAPRPVQDGRLDRRAARRAPRRGALGAGRRARRDRAW
jgi:hypothetical protein